MKTLLRASALTLAFLLCAPASAQVGGSSQCEMKDAFGNCVPGHVLIDPATGLPYAAGGGGGGSTTIKATASAPTYTEGSTTNPLSGDLSGNLRVVVAGGSSSLAAQANAAAQTSSEGATTDPLSMTLARDLRVVAKQSGTWNVSVSNNTDPATATLQGSTNTKLDTLHSDMTAATPAGENHVGEVGGHTMIATCYVSTPPCFTTPASNNTVVAGTGGSSSSTLTVATVSSGSVPIGAYIFNAGVNTGSYISAQQTGSAGSTGTYTMNAALTLATGTTLTLVLPYNSGTLIANSGTAGSVTPLTFANACRVAGGRGWITRVRVTFDSDTGWQNQAVILKLHRDSPTYTNGDRGTWLVTDSKLFATIPVTLDQHLSNAEKGLGDEKRIAFDCASGSTAIYGELVASGQPQPTGGSRNVSATLEGSND